MMVAGGATAFGSSDDNGTKIGLGLFGGGLLTKWILRRRSKKIAEKGHDRILNAIDFYSDNCYDSSKNTLPIVGESNLENGDDNDNEEVLVDIKSNNARTLVVALGPSFSAGYLEDGFLGLGASAFLYKRGLYAHVDAHKIFSISGFSDDVEGLSYENEFHGSATIGVPIFSKIRQGKMFLGLGRIYGLESSGTIDDVSSNIAFGIRGGVTRYRQINATELGKFKQYGSTATLFRAGISWSINSELSYEIDDNRYSEKRRFALSNVILYVDAAYNYDTEYEIIEDSSFPFLNNGEDPAHNKIGGVIGLMARVSSNSRFIAKSIKLELGVLPVNNSASGVYGQVSFGFDIYKVNRN